MARFLERYKGIHRKNSAHQNYGIPSFFPWFPHLPPQKKETRNRFPQFFRPPKTPQAESPRSCLGNKSSEISNFQPTPWEPASCGASCPSKKGQLKELPCRSLRKLQQTCNKCPWVDGRVSACAISKPAFQTSLEGLGPLNTLKVFGRLVVLLLCFQGTVFQ